MTISLRALVGHRRPDAYGRREPLVLLNGLAEQAESWYRNQRYWRRYFDVHVPNIIAYEGAALHRRIDQDQSISVGFLVQQLHLYLEEFVQAPPYHLVASSLGGKVAVEFAVRFPHLVSRVVLLCPSGLGEEERLPLVDGVRRSDFRALIQSVFADPRQVDLDMVEYYRTRFTNRRWRLGLMRTVRGTMDHCVRPLLSRLNRPTLLVTGREDRIVNPEFAEAAARDLPQGQWLEIPNCGHALQLERPRFINRLVVDFLTQGSPDLQVPPAEPVLVESTLLS